VIHFAGLKAVGESVSMPVRYYSNNLISPLYLLEEMASHGVHSFVSSSSATVYGVPEKVPIPETAPAGGTTNPYATTKYMIEEILRDAAKADPSLGVCALRYFNPVGAHPSGMIGENPRGIPNNLMPFITQVAIGRREYLSVFGDDYDTPDGTGVRDYIHVCDLAAGHVAAIEYMVGHKGENVFNLGTGTGYSVLDMVKAFERVTGQKIPYEIAPRRAGDLATVYSSPDKSAELLGWKARYGLEDMCRDAWNWQSKNPMGFRS
jgi:UDP-glucose 4-epimerase